MSGMRGEEDEHPARRRAKRRTEGPGQLCFLVEGAGQKGRSGDSHNRMMATAIRIINTWWYPRKGIHPRKQEVSSYPPRSGRYHYCARAEG